MLMAVFTSVLSAFKDEKIFKIPYSTIPSRHFFFSLCHCAFILIIPHASKVLVLCLSGIQTLNVSSSVQPARTAFSSSPPRQN